MKIRNIHDSFQTYISRTLLIFLICQGIIITSCANNQEEITEDSDLHENDSLEVAIISETDTTEKVEDSYTIEKREVVFFLVNKNEMKNLMHEIGDSYRWETEALFNNFINQAGTFQTILKKHNIKCSLRNNKKFEIKLKNGKTITFNRIEKDQIMGEIISDGENEPRIEFGMYTNADLAKLFEEYYKIKNLGYVQPDSASTGTIQEPAP